MTENIVYASINKFKEFLLENILQLMVQEDPGLVLTKQKRTKFCIHKKFLQKYFLMFKY